MPPQDRAPVKDADLGDEVTRGGSDDAKEISVYLILVLVQYDDSEFWRGRGALGRGRVQRRSKGCYVYVALRKKMLKGHERLRATTAMTVAATVLGE
ncbi:hypothetical protein B296_00018992 [Ensete ventricosum]|uniref:Uncharacterized protein n=1 Tax=Ensete ventricosum TaxID=4639 RepID=A0A426ZAD6_ENSVE|nr:hypothetical protein B296_00018992 [Ensete ventricosum]